VNIAVKTYKEHTIFTQIVRIIFAVVNAPLISRIQKQNLYAFIAGKMYGDPGDGQINILKPFAIENVRVNTGRAKNQKPYIRI
jgi:hypothetical protein